MGVTVQIWKNLPAKREPDYGLENALAKYVRNRWPDKTPVHVQSHFGLSESEALKVVYASASKNTLKKLLHHKRGGFALFLELLCEATGTSLDAYIEKQAEEARREAAQWNAEERRLSTLAQTLGERRPPARERA
jgi:hypothetical protein